MSTLGVVGASPLFRAGLVSLLKVMGFDQVQEGTDIEALKRVVTDATIPEIFLTNLPSQAEDISAIMEEFRSWNPSARVVFLTSDLNVDLLVSCFSEGANGLLLENISCEAFEESLRLVCAGEKVFPSELATLIPGLVSKNGNTAVDMADVRSFQLSDREIDILRCLSIGQSNKVIANTLHIAESTVKVHVKRILQKTHATNRTQAALWGAARGFAMPLTVGPGGTEANRSVGFKGPGAPQPSSTAVANAAAPAPLRSTTGLRVTARQAQSQIPHKGTAPKSP